MRFRQRLLTMATVHQVVEGERGIFRPSVYPYYIFKEKCKGQRSGAVQGRGGTIRQPSAVPVGLRRLETPALEIPKKPTPAERRGVRHRRARGSRWD